MKVNHLILGSSDVQKSAAFYCELFDFQKTSDDPGEVGGQVIRGEVSNFQHSVPVNFLECVPPDFHDSVPANFLRVVPRHS